MMVSGSTDRADLWTLAPGVAHLNHGSYGATPIVVQEARAEWLRRIEASPERFVRDELHDRLAEVRGAVASFLDVDAGSLTLVGNVTEAVAIVLRTVPIEPGSNIVISEDGYQWVTAATVHRARQRSAEVRTVELPVSGPDFAAEAVRRYLKAIDGETALVVIDAITSSTSLRLPVRELVDQLGGRVPVLVDGAHAPGILADPVARGADFWVGALHKWTYAPRGASVLAVADRWRERIEPLVVSDGTDGPFPARFDYTGTRDYSALLSIPAALEFPRTAFDLTWPALTAANVKTLRGGVDRVRERLGATTLATVDLPMATLALPLDADPPKAAALCASLRHAGVEVAAFSRAGRLHVRLSAQPYVTASDFDRFSCAQPLRPVS